jgi:CPA1 family monovalent cation:H+ antiporter
MLEVATQERSDVKRAVQASHRGGEGCDELDAHPAVEIGEGPVCQECLDEGVTWVALRQCLDCGHVACCDSSPRQHATAHFHDTQHPVIQSAEPEEDWRWCYVHHLTG